MKRIVLWGMLHVGAPLMLPCMVIAQIPQTPIVAPLPSATLRDGELQLTYLGNAGWEITNGRTTVIVDPFLSQFADYRVPGRPVVRLPDDILTPDTSAIDARIKRADYILVTHGHADHALDAPYIARKTNARIVGNESVANLARASGVSDSSLITVRGGEDFDFGDFSLKVIPSLHSALFEKRYYTFRGAGQTPRGLKAPLRRREYLEGGTFAYLLRIAGHHVFIMGGMNYIEREMNGLRPTIALVGANSGAGGTPEIYDYVRRLLRALEQPPIVIPTHADAYGDPAAKDRVAAMRRKFADEVRAISPNTRVIIPVWFDPIVVSRSPR